jgi:surface protein
MSYLFAGFETFNEPLHWNTRNVKTMRFMFHKAATFNQPISFDTRAVTDMFFMFSYASSFNQPLSFDTRNVTDMRHMFYGATSFNQPLDFDMQKVSSLGADGMFVNTAIQKRFGITTLKDIPPDHPYIIWSKQTISKARNWNRRKNYVKILSESGFLDGTSRRRHPALSLAAHKTLESKDLSRHIGRFL